MSRSKQPRSVFDPPPLLEVILSSPTKSLLRAVYHSLNSLRPDTKPKEPRIRVVCVSDVHSRRKDIPDGDLMVIAGDLTDDGTPRDIQQQVDGLNGLPHEHKIAIAGNHDYWLDPRARSHMTGDLSPGHVDWRDIHYLQHSSVTLTFPAHGNRQLRIYGAPQIPECGPPYFAFQYPRNHDAWSDTVPSDTDILVTHTPPRHHLDLPIALGCEFLLREIWHVRPKLHVFGHVHAGRGCEIVHWDEAQRAYEAGLARPEGLVRSAFDIVLWVSIVQVAIYGCLGVVWERLWGGGGSPSRLVNASLMYNNTGRLANEAQVVEI